MTHWWKIVLRTGASLSIIKWYDQEIPHSQTADQPTEPQQGGDTEHILSTATQQHDF